jgi:hypothetical protein
MSILPDSGEFEVAPIEVPGELIGRARQVEVPAELIARSHPCGHSVPIIRSRQEPRRARPARNLTVAVLTGLLLFSGLVVAIDLSIVVGRGAGYELSCFSSGTVNRPQSICRWVKVKAAVEPATPHSAGE